MVLQGRTLARTHVVRRAALLPKADLRAALERRQTPPRGADGPRLLTVPPRRPRTLLRARGPGLAGDRA
eukprot:8963749-Alexandrium_andersonii.AAC.1